MLNEAEEDRAAELGYRTAGVRELSLRDWMALQGDPSEPAPTPPAFKKLVGRLAAKKWYHDHKGDEGYEARRQRNNASGRAWTKANRKLCNERQNRRRRAAWRARAGAGIRCADCGVWFCEARPRKGPGRLFCGRTCQNRYDTRMWNRRASLRRGAKQRRKARP